MHILMRISAHFFFDNKQSTAMTPICEGQISYLSGNIYTKSTRRQSTLSAMKAKLTHKTFYPAMEASKQTLQ